MSRHRCRFNLLTGSPGIAREKSPDVRGWVSEAIFGTLVVEFGQFSYERYFKVGVEGMVSDI